MGWYEGRLILGKNSFQPVNWQTSTVPATQEADAGLSPRVQGHLGQKEKKTFIPGSEVLCNVQWPINKSDLKGRAAISRKSVPFSSPLQDSNVLRFSDGPLQIYSLSLTICCWLLFNLILPNCILLSWNVAGSF